MKIVYDEDAKKEAESHLLTIWDDIAQAERDLQKTVEEELHRVSYKYITDKTLEVMQYLFNCVKEIQKDVDDISVVCFAKNCRVSDATLENVHQWSDRIKQLTVEKVCGINLDGIQSIQTDSPQIREDDFDKIVSAFDTFSSAMLRAADNHRKMLSEMKGNLFFASLPDFLYSTCINPLSTAAKNASDQIERCKNYFVETVLRELQKARDAVASVDYGVDGNRSNPQNGEVRYTSTGGTAQASPGVVSSGSVAENILEDTKQEGDEFDWKYLRECATGMTRSFNIRECFSLFIKFYESVYKSAARYLEIPLSEETVASREMKNLYSATKFALIYLGEQFIRRSDFGSGLDDFWEKGGKIPDQADALSCSGKTLVAQITGLKKPKWKDFDRYSKLNELLMKGINEYSARELFFVSFCFINGTHMSAVGKSNVLLHVDDVLNNYMRFASNVLTGNVLTGEDQSEKAKTITQSTFIGKKLPVTDFMKDANRFSPQKIANFFKRAKLAPVTSGKLEDYAEQSFRAVELGRTYADLTLDYMEREAKVQEGQSDSINNVEEKLGEMAGKVVGKKLGKKAGRVVGKGVSSVVRKLDSETDVVKTFKSVAKHIPEVEKELIGSSEETKINIKDIQTNADMQLKGNPYREEFSSGLALERSSVKAVRELAQTNPKEASILLAAYQGALRYMKNKSENKKVNLRNAGDQKEFITHATAILILLERKYGTMQNVESCRKAVLSLLEN